MIIGKLRHRIVIQQPSVTRETDGGNAITYTGTQKIWAQVKMLSQSEGEIGDKVTASTDVEIIVRRNIFTDAVNAKSRIVWEGANYNVSGVVTDERKIYRTIKAQLIQ